METVTEKGGCDMKKSTAFLTAVIMSAAIAATPVTTFAASNQPVSEQITVDQETGGQEDAAEIVVPDVKPEDETVVPSVETEDETAVPDVETEDETAVPDAETEDETAAPELTDEMLESNDALMPWSSLEEAINNASSGDTIFLTGRVIGAPEYGTLVIPKGMKLTIDMQGYVIDLFRYEVTANGSVFKVEAGAELTLMNGTVSGGFSKCGGGICNYGTFNAQHVEICSNQISTENAACYGAGIYNKGTINLTDCSIHDNYGNDGGGIFNDSMAYATLVRVSLDGNTSVNHGGGGLVNYGLAYLTDCTVTENAAKGDGGGIWSTQYVAMNRCLVDGNNSASAGGGICIKNGSMDFCDSFVTDNTSADGGGIYVGSASAVVNAIGTSDISNNVSKEHGGGGVTNYGTLNADGSLTVTGNQAKSNGGGIWNKGTFSVNGHICVDTNKSDTRSNNNLYLYNGTVITVAGPIDSDSKIVVSGDKMPGIFTSGWSAKNPSGDLDVIGFEKNAVPVLDGGELGVGCTYMARTLNPATKEVEETEQKAPECLKAFPSRVSEGGWFAVMDGTQTAGRITVPNGKTVNLVLMDGVDIRLDGIYVAAGGTLNIYGQKEDTGKLICQGGKYQAGIGGNDETAHGTINIYGGTVAATGGDYGAGIGMGDESEGTCGNITVYGGMVEARGGTDAAGIGGGNEGRGAKINIYGGSVHAYGGKYGAGIGAGDDRGLDCVRIYGGSVYAKGGKYGAGIGEGYSADSDTSNGIIHIEGGDIQAVGISGSAGIGGGAANNTRCTILIDGGTVDASSENVNTPEYGGAGIGGGCCIPLEGGGDFRGVIRITGGTVKATGGGYDTGPKNSYNGGAGIGGGNRGDMEGTIEITGGDVMAVGRYGGAAIGAGESDNFIGGDFQGRVVIEGGGLELLVVDGITAGDDKCNPHYIGNGYDGSDEGTLTLSDRMDVRYEGCSPVAKEDRDSACRSFGYHWLFISE